MLRALVALALSTMSALALAAGDPAQTVTAFHDSLLEAMHAGAAAGCAGRAKTLGPAIDTDFDVPALAERVLRRQWGTLDAGQRQHFIAAFRDLVVATYASRFASFGGERFSTLDTVDQPGDLKLVHSRLQPGHGDPVSFDYLLHPVEGRWKIVNIVADGVSDLAVRSTQYDEIIRQRGFDGLLDDLKKQTQSARDCR